MRYAILLALLTLTFACTGCDERAAASHKTRLVVSVPASASERSPFKEAIANFEEAHPDIEVQLLSISGSYYQKLLTMIAGGKGPDVMWMGQSFSEFANRGIFMDISRQLEDDGQLANISAELLNWYRINDRQYGVPFGIDIRFMMYNKQLFDAAGVPYPTNDWTVDQFMDAARRLTTDTNGDGRVDQFGFLGDLDFSLFKAQIIEPDGSAAACDKPEMLDFFHMNLKMRNEDRIALPATKRPDEAIAIFQQNRVAMMQVATWDLPFMRERLTDMDFDIVTNPSVAEQSHWASSQAMVIAADTRHPDAAWQLCKAFLNESFQRAASEFILPANRHVAETVVAENVRAPHNLQALLVASESLRPIPRVPRMVEMIQVYNNASDAVWSGESSPESAMAAAAVEINQILRSVHAEAAR